MTMRLHRFNVVQPLGEEVVIDDVSLINQWTKVFRYKVSDFVILFNGDGNDYSYSLNSITPKSCTLTKKSSSPSHIPTKKTYLYVAIIKKDHFELVAQKATELGVTDIIPLISERTEKKALDFRRLSLVTKEASEQSGRGDVPVIHEPSTLGKMSAHLVDNKVQPSRTLAGTLHGKPLSEVLDNIPKAIHEPCAFIVGPEGGWTDSEELFLKDQHFVLVSYGVTTLRAETAGIVSSFISSLI